MADTTNQNYTPSTAGQGTAASATAGQAAASSGTAGNATAGQGTAGVDQSYSGTAGKATAGQGTASTENMNDPRLTIAGNIGAYLDPNSSVNQLLRTKALATANQSGTLNSSMTDSAISNGIIANSQQMAQNDQGVYSSGAINNANLLTNTSNNNAQLQTTASTTNANNETQTSNANAQLATQASIANANNQTSTSNNNANLTTQASTTNANNQTQTSNTNAQLATNASTTNANNATQTANDNAQLATTTSNNNANLATQASTNNANNSSQQLIANMNNANQIALQNLQNTNKTTLQASSAAANIYQNAITQIEAIQANSSMDQATKDTETANIINTTNAALADQAAITGINVGANFAGLTVGGVSGPAVVGTGPQQKAAAATSALTTDYQTYLGRAPDAAGLAWYQQQIASGALTQAQADDAIKNSTEAQAYAASQVQQDPNTVSGP